MNYQPTSRSGTPTTKRILKHNKSVVISEFQYTLNRKSAKIFAPSNPHVGNYDAELERTKRFAANFTPNNDSHSHKEEM